MKFDHIDPNLYEQVESELLAGEELLWIGQPNRLRMLVKNPLQAGAGLITGLVLAAFFAGVFVFVSETGGNDSSLPWILAAVLLMSLVSLLSSPVRNYLKAGRTIYAITDRRALIISGILSQSVQSYGKNDIQFIERKKHGGNTGDIIFDREHHTRERMYGGPSSYSVPVGFLSIPNVREVEALMLETFRSGAGFDKPKRSRLEDEYTDEEVYEYEDLDANEDRLQS